MVIFDADVLSLLLNPNARPPSDSSGNSVEQSQARLEYLVEILEKAKEKILIPTPALSEFLVLVAEDASEYLTELNNSAVFKVIDFDQRAAIEAAKMASAAMERGGKRGDSAAPWSKIKFDRQIVAIAKVEGAHTIYSNDEHIENLGDQTDIKVIGVGELPLPPPETGSLPFDESEEDTKEETS